jgi:hypothetical protein
VGNGQWAMGNGQWAMGNGEGGEHGLPFGPSRGTGVERGVPVVVGRAARVRRRRWAWCVGV